MTRGKLLLATILCIAAFASRAQYNLPQSRIWAMGNKVGLDFTVLANPVPMITSLANPNEAAASICDTAGHLLFYTNGMTVWNRSGTQMPNGTGLISSGSTLSTTQGTVIVPVPDSAGKYYIFSLTAVSNCKLYVNKIDMSLDGGMGDVVTSFPLRFTSLADSFLTEKMTAVTGCNNSVWLMVHTQNSPVFKAFHIVDTGIVLTPVISAVSAFAVGNYVQGVMKFSPDATKMLNCNFRATAPTNAGVEVFNFDRTTGLLSGGIILDSGSHYGGNFSPDGLKVYAGSTAASKIFQWDLTASSPAASKLMLGPSGQYTDLKIGPDGKIYFGALAGSPGYNNYRFMGRINAPNNAGAACLFQDSVTSLIFPATSGSYGALAQAMPNDVAVPVKSVEVHLRSLDSAICSSFASYTLTAPAGFATATWDDGTSLPIRHVTARGTYWVRSTSVCEVRVDTFVLRGSDMPALTITYASHILAATAGFSTYRWYKNGTLLSGITANTLTATGNGTYAVYGDFGTGCDDSTSRVVNDINVGLSAHNTGELLMLYPNPARNTVYIDYPESVNISLVSMDGKLVMSVSGTHQVDLSQLADGVYMALITDKANQRIAVRKLIKSAQ